MNKKLLSVVSAVLFFQTSAQTNLQTEHLINPIGIDVSHPRFSWQSTCNETATVVLIGTDSTAPLQEYKSQSLKPYTKYYWRVKVWDKNKKTHLSAAASFETGPAEWFGSWITDTKDIKRKTAPFFKKEIEIKNMCLLREFI